MNQPEADTRPAQPAAGSGWARVYGAVVVFAVLMIVGLIAFARYFGG